MSGCPRGPLNLQANRNADAQVRGKRRQMRAGVAEGEERGGLSQQMNEQYGRFED
jgi:hypothetical protein